MPGNARALSSVFGDDLLRCFLQIACPAVITQAGPQAQDFLLRRGSECVNVREALQKSFVVGKRGGNARLLQHDFREPDAIGIFSASPRQITLKLAKPAKK
jgi:hypothetical protein